MAVTFLTGFEAGAAGLDGVTLLGVAAAISTVRARTGLQSLRCNPTSGDAYATIPTGSYVHFGLYMETVRNNSDVRIFGDGAVGASVKCVAPATPNGTFTLQTQNNGLSLGGAITVTVGAWHWIGIRTISGTGVPFLQVDGVSATAGTATISGTPYRVGAVAISGTGWDIYIDDIISDDTGFIAPSKVIDLLPTADSAIGTGWTLGSGGTTNLWGGVDNQPPTAVADAGTTAQIRNAASAAASNYDATLQTYTVGGMGASDTILAVQNVIATGAPVATSAKLGKVGNVSNPAITTIALAAGGTAAAFWSGVAAGTYPTGWKASTGTLTASPSVTKGTAPVMRVTQDTASTRIAMVAYMALRVAWTPAAGTPVTGTGAGAGTASTSTGAAAETMSGTGSGTGSAATASGTGTVTAAATTGTGAGTQAAQTATGSALETIIASGAAIGIAPSAAGLASESMTGSGAGSQVVQTATGTGSSLTALTGSGAGVSAPATAAGSGDVAALGEVTGTGAGVQVPQSGSGAGTVEGGIEVPPSVEGSTIYAPKLRVIAGTGGGVQARQSAKGRGTVNDDDLVVLAA